MYKYKWLMGEIDMIRKEIVICNQNGLHERFATALIKKASKYKSEITICKGKAKINAKSILGLFSIGINLGDIIELEIDGEDEELASEELVKYLTQ